MSECESHKTEDNDGECWRRQGAVPPKHGGTQDGFGMGEEAARGEHDMKIDDEFRGGCKPSSGTSCCAIHSTEKEA